MSTNPQRNTPLSVSEALVRLQAFGLRLISDHLDDRVTTTTKVLLECGAGHRLQRIYGNVRKRGCPECKAPFGERLLYTLLRHYAVGLDDWGAKVVRGLDQMDPNRKVVFDAASESRKVAIENHSEYHDPTKSIPRFEERISKEERLRLDAIKESRETGGHHSTGPLAGWVVGVVWFEAARMVRVRDESGTYLHIAISEFKQLAQKIGLQLRNDNVDIDAATVYAGLGRGHLDRISGEFQLVGVWLGRARTHQWRHSCGCEFNAVISELENNSPGSTGCPCCDRTGHFGKWLDFLDRLNNHGYEFAGQNRLSIRTEFKSIPVRCSKHAGAQVQVWTRSKWYQWMASLHEDSSTSFPPACATCAIEYARRLESEAGKRIGDERQKLALRLREFGFEMVTMLPTSVRDTVTNKVVPQRNTVRCLASGCSHEWEIYVAQQLAKAEKRGKMGCPKCSPLKKGPKPKAPK
ncbi:Unknown protein sequence [Pseudomonas syringae pv. philadelphi]|nr:Unknown protein sequence [Pseudomonas syringae pv. berberidis]KPY23217.1 Unknown protein sequence [Pseudomonas syringae pv. philadelphi]RMM37071.1 hypothetical protein ALQ83_03734 [Pseudomonas syringae pv. berberidis]RMP66885.1 hypothetical protein ALQ19_03257 [Pseudomonas syringae pv. berberidis]RMQ32790.1 hypothetical protein ALQ06_04413 [Pseudomonas syringae pv. berberidis]